MKIIVNIIVIITLFLLTLGAYYSDETEKIETEKTGVRSYMVAPVIVPTLRQGGSSNYSSGGSYSSNRSNSGGGSSYGK